MGILHLCWKQIYELKCSVPDYRLNASHDNRKVLGCGKFLHTLRRAEREDWEQSAQYSGLGNFFWQAANVKAGDNRRPAFKKNSQFSLCVAVWYSERMLFLHSLASVANFEQIPQKRYKRSIRKEQLVRWWTSVLCAFPACICSLATVVSGDQARCLLHVQRKPWMSCRGCTLG